MAVDPDVPFNREEMYLAAAAGEGVTVPECPWSRKEAYLADIGGRLDDMDERIAALATDISFKGSVATETDLPSGAAVGDAYITEDTGVMYVWTGDSWVALGGTGINVVQTTGTSQTDVMSQNATTGMVFTDPSTKKKIAIGSNSSVLGTAAVGIAIGEYAYSEAQGVAIGSTTTGSTNNRTSAGGAAVALGGSAKASGGASLSIGFSSTASAHGSIGLGAGANASQVGQMDIGAGSTWGAVYGYNGTAYRLLTGLYDPVGAHDAATKGYVDGLVGDIETALHAINNGGSN